MWLVRDSKFADFNGLYKFVINDKNESLDAVVSRLLFALGFRNKLIGTAYFKEAILLFYRLPSGIRVNLSDDIYSAIARLKSTTSKRVEKDIRNCIQDCYFSGKLFAFNSLARCEYITNDYPVTNGELLTNIVSWLRIALEDVSSQNDDKL